MSFVIVMKENPKIQHCSESVWSNVEFYLKVLRPEILATPVTEDSSIGLNFRDSSWFGNVLSKGF